MIRQSRTAIRLAAAALVLTSAACRESSRSPGGGTQDKTGGPVGGTIAIAAVAEPDNLLPPLTATNVGREVVDQVFDYLADLGPSLNTIGDAGFTPRLATSWTWAPDSLSVAFHLAPNAKWHDGVPVRAADVRFTYRLVTDSVVASPVASLLPDVDSVGVRDSLTAVVWFKRRAPEGFFQFVYNVAILPEHLLKSVPRNGLAASWFARHPVGSGRFRFTQWDAGSRVVLVTDSANYRGRARLDRVVWVVAPDPATATTRFLAGESQVLEDVSGPTFTQVARAPSARVVTMAGLNYGYLGFNLRRPAFADRAVRRALSMSVDRAALVRNVFDTVAAPGIGPVTRALPSADTTLPRIAYDSAQARTVLASHHVRPFTILVPTSSAIRMKYATLLQEQFARAGVTVTIDALELNAFAKRLQARDFDAVLNAWHTDPTPSAVVQAWGSAAATNGPNFTSYRSAAFDTLVARGAYRAAYGVITDDAPAIWLYEAKAALGVDRRVTPAGIRPDAWWAGLADWTIAR